MNIKELSIDKKVGQRFIFGVNDMNVDAVIELIKTAHIGGVILYKKNYKNYQEMVDVIKRCKEANKGNNIPLFIAIDQEGGVVNRMPSEIHNLKNIYDVSRIDNNCVSEYADIISSMLYHSGINMNLGPVLDIYNNSKSKVLYKRCFYGNKEDVARDGIKYVKESNKNKVVPVIKHFPGHGASTMDSHFIIPFIFDYDDVLNKHVFPFETVFKDTPAMMLGHLVIRKITGLLPVTMCNDFITKYIRERYNYNGIVMTDEINMLKKHLLYRFTYLDKILKSDNDIILVKIKNANEGYKIINKYKKILNKEINNIEKLNKHVERIIDVKNMYDINDTIDYNGIDIDKSNKRIDEINKLFS